MGQTTDPGAANAGTCPAYDDATREHVGSLVVLFVPGLVVFVSDTEIDGESGSCFEIILDVAGRSPLAVSNPAERC